MPEHVASETSGLLPAIDQQTYIDRVECVFLPVLVMRVALAAHSQAKII